MPFTDPVKLTDQPQNSVSSKATQPMPNKIQPDGLYAGQVDHAMAIETRRMERHDIQPRNVFYWPEPDSAPVASTALYNTEVPFQLGDAGAGAQYDTNLFHYRAGAGWQVTMYIVTQHHTNVQIKYRIRRERWPVILAVPYDTPHLSTNEMEYSILYTGPWKRKFETMASTAIYRYQFEVDITNPWTAGLISRFEPRMTVVDDSGQDPFAGITGRPITYTSYLMAFIIDNYYVSGGT